MRESRERDRRRALLIAAPLLLLLIAGIIYLATRGGDDKPVPGPSVAKDPAAGPATGPATGPTTSATFGPQFIATLGSPSVPDDEIEPADGATVRGTEALVRWRGPAKAEGRVLWRAAGGAGDFTATPAAGATEFHGDPLVASLSGLKPGQYEYVVEHAAGGLAQRSRSRKLTMQAGPAVAFTPALAETTVKRDYNQVVKLNVKNDTPEKVTIAARAAAHYPDLPADVVGPGSADEPAELAPGSAMDLTLMIAAPDARRATYDIPVEAGGAIGTARVRIDNPKVQLSVKVVGEDPRTLAKIVEIRNDGDAALTDLAVAVAAPNDGEARLEPSVAHATLERGGSLRMTVAPVLYLEFQSLKAELDCRAAGQSVRFPVEFAAPQGRRLIGVRHASGESNKAKAKYCTNNPNICTPVPAAQGGGPVGSVLSKVGGAFGFGRGKGDCNCDVEQACETIAQIQALIDRYSAGDPRFNNFREFIAALDDLLGDLSNKDLACRYEKNSNIPAAQVEALLQGIRRARHGFKSMNDGSFMPSATDCAYEVDNSFRRTPAGERKCHDYHAIIQISALLDDLAAQIGCPPPPSDTKSKFNPCPELGDLDKINKKLSTASTYTDRASKVVKNPKAKAALQKAAGILKFITRHLGKLLKGQKYCAMLKELLNVLDNLDKAQTPAENAKAFDELFRNLFKWGEEFLPWPFSTYAKELQDTTLFEDLSKSLPPDERWKRQFEGIDWVGEEQEGNR